MVEWMEKASFDLLNKLFVISVGQWNHETLLTDQDSQPYIVPILPCFAPRVLVPDEHHVLKDLPFKEET